MSRFLGTPVTRVGVALAAAGLAIALAPASAAHAESAGGTMHLSLSNAGERIEVGSDGDGKVVFATIDAENALKPVLTTKVINTVGHEITVTPLLDGCTATPAETTCPLPAGTYHGLVVPLRVKSAAGARVGTGSAFLALVKAENSDLTGGDRRDVAIADGPDLVAEREMAADQHAKPGDTIWIPATFHNEGNRTADNAGFSFSFAHGLAPEHYAGCVYDEGTLGTYVTCPLGQPLAPGEQVTFVTDDGTKDGHPGMAVKVTGDAVGYVESMFIADGESSLATGRPSAAADGKRFTARAAKSAKVSAQDVNTWDDVVTYYWTIPNFTDIAAVGTTVTGKVGDTVKATIGIKNVGGASVTDLTPSDGTASWEYDFDVPAGTTVVSLPDNCFAEYTPQDNENFDPRALGRPFYVCWDFDAVFAPGSARTSEFGLKITQEISGATGTVSFKNPYRKTERNDDNAANNVAQVIVNPAGGGLLPVTGAQTAIVAAVGAVLLTAGAVLFRLARRRRVLLVTPGHDGR